MQVTLDGIEPLRSRGALGWTAVTSLEGRVYAASIACLAALFFYAHTFVPSCFDDCYGYILLMGVSPFSPHYWPALPLLYRGFCIPILYSLFGAYNEYSAQAVVIFQAFVAFLSWIACALAMAGNVSGARARWLFFMLVAGGMFSRGYFRFDDRFLSDSLALSLILIWLAIMVSPLVLMDLVQHSFGRAWLPVFVAIVALVTAMAGSARGSNVLLMVCCTPIVLLRLWPDAAMRRYAVLMAVVILSICALQWREDGRRQGFNMANIIAGIVLPSPERRQYFAERGMPPWIATLHVPPRLRGRTLREITDDRSIVLHEITAVRNVILDHAPYFLRTRARAIYSSYLLQHPRYVLANIIESWRLMFDQFYTDAARWPQYLSAMDWIGIRLFAAISLALVFFVPAGWRDFLIRAGVLLGLAGFANSVIAFHGDLWEASEMGRHAWVGSTFLRLGCGVICFRAVSLLMESRRKTPA